jgi:Matrixin
MNRLLTLIFLTALMVATMSLGQAASAATPRKANIQPARAQRSALASVNSRNPVTTATAIAEGFWGAVPCGGQVKLVAKSPLPRGLDPSTDGWVTFGSSLGPDNMSAPAATYTDCTISLARWQWGSWTDMESDWGMFCLTVIHEMGHLLGHKHSLAPGSVMAPVFTSNANVPNVCNRTWLAGWR